MTIARDLQAGIAQLLEDAGAGTWQPTGVYAQGLDRPIYVRAVPASPDRVITVSHYPVTQQAWTSDTVEGIQVRNRGSRDNPSPADDDADAIRAALDGLEHIDVGGHHVNLIAWQSGAVMGLDENRRWEMSQNFYLYTTRVRRNTSD